ncbi:thioredoxin family protein [Litchfieldia salsa]|uniref:Thioredoxin n=1 Tax=Litchfieldia salsa TaxID=930152 RepID=A0A1H0WSF8_9BACI|nr:thioredoxin family protein [Litchfieldia salsa]SDP93628.1 Thioredoxin [Litchfieldia salsa]
MKKIIIFVSIIVVLFGGLAFATSYANKKAAEGNPYGKAKLNPATTKQLDDPNYQNQILPEELEESLKNNETLTVYFYSPTCAYCQQTTPILVPLVDDLGVDVKKLNLLEFEDGWQDFAINSTPTLIHYENGKEVKRIEGLQTEETFREWFSDIESKE